MYYNKLEDTIRYARENKSFSSLNRIEQADNVCVFGLGTYFREAFVSQNTKKLYHVNLLSDNNPEKWGQTIEGLPCVSPEELKKYPNLIVIIMMGNPSAVEKQLKDMDIPYVYHIDVSLDRIMKMRREPDWFENEIPVIKEVYNYFKDDFSKKVYVGALMNRMAAEISTFSWEDICSSENHYFNPDVIEMNDHESFVDCGAYNGDTIIEFINEVQDYKQIFAFEVDKDNYQKMLNNVSRFEKIKCFNYGVWSENKELEYGVGTSDNEPDDGKSILKTESGKNNIIQKAKVVSIDEELAGEEITFIKMDIEGVEIEALKGAEKIIKEQKPKLAICVYHRTSDFWQIPKLLKEFNPEYQFMLRHYTRNNLFDTVLYAK